jgi:ABC-type sugar transport system substrate-binding protein
MSEKILVALLDERQDYSRLEAAEAEAAAERVSLPVEIVYAENNALVQIHELYARIHAPEAERPTAILVHSVTGEGLERVARHAVDAGIGWILLNRRVAYVDELRGKYPELPIGRVSLDQRGIGRIQGRQVLALAPQGGLLLYVSGPLDTSAAQDRLAGTEEVLKDAGFRWKVLNGNRTEEGARSAVGGWLRVSLGEDQRPTVIVAQNDWMAKGALGAFIERDPGRPPIPTLGCDGLSDHGQNLVKAGRLVATVITPACAARGLELVDGWLQGRSLPAEVLIASRSFPSEQQLRAA